MAKRPSSVSDWTPTKPTTKLADSAVLQPNANVAKNALPQDSPFKQAMGKSGKPSGPLGPRGRET